MKRHIIYVAGLLLVLVALYWVATTPDPSGYGDSDELLTVSYLGGVAHPPGYAMLTAVSGSIMNLVPWVPPAYIGNLLAGLMMAAGLGLSALGLVRLLPKKSPLLIVLGVVVVGTTYLIFQWATVFEVTAGSVLLAGSLWFGLGSWQAVSGRFRWWWGLAVWGVFGMLVGHYQPAILLGPGLLYLYVLYVKQNKFSLNTLLGQSAVGMGVMAGGFMIMQVPLWAQIHSGAPVSWYVDPSIQGIVKHVFRADYGGPSLEQGREFATYINVPHLLSSRMIGGMGRYGYWLVSHMGWVVGLAGAGMYYLWKKRREWFWVLGSWWLLSGVVFGGYVLSPLPESQQLYFEGIALRQIVLSQWVVGLAGIVGLVWIGSVWKRAGFILAGALIALNLWYNLPLLLEGHSRAGAGVYAQAALASADENALVICTSDIDCFSLFYASEVEGIRPDVLVVPHAISYRVGYMLEHPQVYPFGVMAEPDYLGNLIAWNAQDRPVYVTQGIRFYTDYIGLEAGPFYTVPEGVLFRLTTEYPTVEEGADTAWRDPRVVEAFGRQVEDRRNVWWLGIQETMSTMWAYAGYLSLRYGESEIARGYLDHALVFDPSNIQAQQLVMNLDEAVVVLKLEDESKEARDYLIAAREALANQDVALAEENYRKATYLDTENEEAIEALVHIYEQSGMEERAFMWQEKLISAQKNK